MTFRVRTLVALAVLSALAVLGLYAYHATSTALHARDGLAAVPGSDAARAELGRDAVESVVLAVALGGTICLLSAHVTSAVLTPLRHNVVRIREAMEGDQDARIVADGPADVQDLADALNDGVGSQSRRERSLRHQERAATTSLLLTGVAHAINNPLTFLALNAQASQRDLERLATDPAVPEAHRPALERAVRRNARNLEGIARLSEVSALLREITTKDPVAHDHRIDRIVDASLILTQHAFLHARVEVETVALATRCIACRPAEVAHALVEVILNAVESMPQGGRVRIVTRDTPAGVAVDVSDTGTGIPAAVQSHLFRPHASTKRGRPGLGLATVKYILGRHDGTVSYTTGPAGTTFTLALPESPTRAGPA